MFIHFSSPGILRLVLLVVWSCLIHCFQHCKVLSASYMLQEAVKIGYEPEEVEFAVNHFDRLKGEFKTPLDFLQMEWHERKRMVRTHIGQFVEERGMEDVGMPSLIEARDCLVECGGRMNEAIALCVRRREEKVGVPGMGSLHNVLCSV